MYKGEKKLDKNTIWYICLRPIPECTAESDAFSKVGGLCQWAYMDEPILLLAASAEALLLLVVEYQLRAPSTKKKEKKNKKKNSGRERT